MGILSFLLSKIFFITGAVTGGNSFKNPLSKEDEEKYLALAGKGDRNAKSILVEHNLRLVAHIVKKYKGAGETDDLISVGSMGLAKAIDTFDKSKGVSLATFASRCIENEILMLIRANKKYKNTISIWDEVGTDKDGNSLQIIDVLTDDEDSVFKSANDEMTKNYVIKKMRSVLNEREFKVIEMRFGIGSGCEYAQREVAKKLKISRSYVSRIEKKAIEKLRTVIKKEDLGF